MSFRNRADCVEMNSSIVVTLMALSFWLPSDHVVPANGVSLSLKVRRVVRFHSHDGIHLTRWILNLLSNLN